MAEVDNRATLLSSALQLFAERGYDAVGTQEIVEAAGVTKPTLYHYFRSKMGLLETLLDETFQGLNGPLREASTWGGDLPKALAAVARSYFGFAREHPEFYRLALSLWFAPLKSPAYTAVLRHRSAQFALVEGLFVSAQREHANIRGKQRPYAATFMGMVDNYVALALNGYTPLNEKLVEHAVHQFVYGIFA